MIYIVTQCGGPGNLTRVFENFMTNSAIPAFKVKYLAELTNVRTVWIN